MNDGGPAFPVVHAIVPQPGHFTSTPAAKPGMSLRDYFAAAALTGICTTDFQAVRDQAAERGVSPSLCLAKICYDFADAMLAEREKPETHQGGYGG